MQEKKLPSYRSWNQHVEYRNVDMAHEYAQYANDHKPLWSFPYFRQIGIITWVLASSMRQGAKKTVANHESLWDYWTSDYTTMSLFVWLTTTLEYTAKGLAGLVLFLPMLFAKKQNNNFAKHLAKELSDYAQFLHTTPWFDYDFAAHIQSIEQTYQQIPKDQRSWKDYVQKQFIVMDWRAKKAIAPFIQKQFPSQDKNFAGTNTNYGTSETGTFISMPVYDAFTDWIHAAYTQSALPEGHNNKYTKPCRIQSLWGHTSAMCRVRLPNTKLAPFKQTFQTYIVSEYQNGVDNTTTLIVDIPWQATLSNSSPRTTYAIAEMLTTYYHPKTKNIHFHDFYAPPSHDIDPYADIGEALEQKHQAISQRTNLVRFAHQMQRGLAAPRVAKAVVAYDKRRPNWKRFSFLGHISMLPLLGVLLSSAIIFDLAVWAACQPIIAFLATWQWVAHASPRPPLAQWMQRHMRLYELKHLLRLPFTLFDPSYLANTLIHTPAHVVSGGGLYQASRAPIRPRSEQELRDVVQQAAKTGNTISVQGAGLSQGQQFVPAATPGKDKTPWILDLSLLKLNCGKARCHPDSMTVTAHARATWHDVQQIIAPHGLALPVMQASNIFSVGGSVSTNIHGWNHHLGSLCNHIARLRVMDGTGTIRTIVPSDADFGKIVGGFGRYGILLDVTLKLIPNRKVVLQSKMVSLKDYIADFKQNIEKNPTIAMHVGRLPIQAPEWWSSDTCPMICSMWNYDIDQSSHKESIAPYKKEATPVVSEILLNAMMRIPLLKKAFWNREVRNETRAKNPPQTLNQTMNFAIHPMLRKYQSSEQYWLQEYFLPEENIVAFTKQLGSLLHKNDVALINASIRFVKAEVQKTAMPYAKKDRYALVICWKQSMRNHAIEHTRQWVQTAIDQALQLNGTYYLPYQHFATQAQFDKAYPMASTLTHHKKPSETVFENGLGLYMQPPKTGLFDLNRGIDKMAGFFQVVFTQYDFQAFRAAVVDTMSKTYPSEQALYQALQKRVKKAHKGMSSEIGALRSLQAALSKQASDLWHAKQSTCAPSTPTNNLHALEIGTYARYTKHLQRRAVPIAKTDILAPKDAPGVAQMLIEQQSLSPLWKAPYDAHTHLMYENVSQVTLPTDTYDLITAFAGVHHFSAKQVDRFLQEIHNSLKVGGVFLLVEHDQQGARGADTLAHTIFNLGQGVPYEEDRDEIRNFQPLSVWLQKVQATGLRVIEKSDGTPNQYTRQGDPSLNTMLGFFKPHGACASSSTDMLLASPK